MKAVGVCVGASTIKIVELESKSPLAVQNAISIPHEGDPKGALVKSLSHINVDAKVAVTGRKFKQLIDLSSISEAEAVEIALTYLRKKDKKYEDIDSIVSLGGENFITYVLDKEGKIVTAITGSKCASGTGEFFLQQIGRMNINVDEATNKAKQGSPYQVAGRCSVFCKSDCTHALNKGIPKENVLAGLCQMMAQKVIEQLDKTKKKNKVMLVGGVTKNHVIVDLLKKEITTVIVPEEAPYFEALGVGLWALNNKIKPFTGVENLLKKEFSSLKFLEPLKNFESNVEFKETKKDTAKEGDICIIGLDVGSTTTKAIVLRTEDNAILASIYLRTNGDPVRASKECYKSLKEQIPANIKIVGLGVTGSGRQIAGLHALTDAVINEIIAHATAAIQFDPEVDTIFEIGGQDAKYTYITNGVASDYAMNEACSAGTGSFLEESAKETLSVEMTEIAGMALKGQNPPNFNDQCAAFISSDIKNALHEGFEKEDILAGLVYSICMNYANRVKGNRPMGKKVFMQGGVCYNKAVPIAMTALTGKKIIVPPEPGLMGAFGVALEVKKRQKANLLKETNFDLDELSKREIEYGKSFICAGGEEKCDRKCQMITVKIGDKTYPFGGACNKYANLRLNLNFDAKKLDLVVLRQSLLFEKYANFKPTTTKKTIGINRSLLVETLYPLYYNFFSKLGLKVVLPDKIEKEGINKKGAAFCYPVEISHGHMESLLKKDVDYFFLPHVRNLHVEKGVHDSCTCPFVQGETYYLRTAFKELRKKIVLAPIIDFHKGFDGEKSKFVKMGLKLGFDKGKSVEAFEFAVKQQIAFQKEIKEIGKKVLKELEEDPSKIGIVVFGRPYNAFSKIANMGIPHKFASRGILTIPFDFLPYAEEKNLYNMYWSIGQMITKTARFVKKHPQLFATYITNFSCGPDSFIITYFREIMGKKPSLTLELDSHTSDVGVNTRIEAALDIMGAYRQFEQHRQESQDDFRPAEIKKQGKDYFVITSSQETLSLKDKRVKIVFPSMGDITVQLIAAGLTSEGFDVKAANIPTMEELRYGRAHSSCKECLPLQLTVGTLIKYAKNKDPNEVLVYFMPENRQGPCRFGQYPLFMKNLIRKEKITNTAVFSPYADEGYAGLPMFRSIMGIIAADVLDDIKNALKVLAVDKIQALKIFDEEFNKLKNAFSDKKKKPLVQLKEMVKILNDIPLKYSLSQAKVIALIGEIYVRRDSFSRQNLEDKLAEKGFIVRVAPVTEWLHYVVYVFKHNIHDIKYHLTKKAMLHAKAYSLSFIEKKVKNIFKDSKLYDIELVDVEDVISHAKHLMSPKLGGEAILTIGSGLKEILHNACGVISVGPFGCMPSRLAEAILSEEMNASGKEAASGKKINIPGLYHLPFLAIETDGNPFPPIIESKLEAFYLQANRLHEKMMQNKKNSETDSKDKSTVSS